MKRRKHRFTQVYENFEEVTEYVTRVKRINGKRVEIEIHEDVHLGCWLINVWEIR